MPNTPARVIPINKNTKTTKDEEARMDNGRDASSSDPATAASLEKLKTIYNSYKAEETRYAAEVIGPDPLTDAQGDTVDEAARLVSEPLPEKITANEINELADDLYEIVAHLEKLNTVVAAEEKAPAKADPTETDPHPVRTAMIRGYNRCVDEVTARLDGIATLTGKQGLKMETIFANAGVPYFSKQVNGAVRSMRHLTVKSPWKLDEIRATYNLLTEAQRALAMLHTTLEAKKAADEARTNEPDPISVETKVSAPIVIPVTPERASPTVIDDRGAETRREPLMNAKDLLKESMLDRTDPLVTRKVHTAAGTESTTTPAKTDESRTNVEKALKAIETAVAKHVSVSADDLLEKTLFAWKKLGWDNNPIIKNSFLNAIETLQEAMGDGTTSSRVAKRACQEAVVTFDTLEQKAQEERDKRHVLSTARTLEAPSSSVPPPLPPAPPVPSAVSPTLPDRSSDPPADVDDTDVDDDETPIPPAPIQGSFFQKHWVKLGAAVLVFITTLSIGTAIFFATRTPVDTSAADGGWKPIDISTTGKQNGSDVSTTTRTISKGSYKMTPELFAAIQKARPDQVKGTIDCVYFESTNAGDKNDQRPSIAWTDMNGVTWVVEKSRAAGGKCFDVSGNKVVVPKDLQVP